MFVLHIGISMRFEHVVKCLGLQFFCFVSSTDGKLIPVRENEYCLLQIPKGTAELDLRVSAVPEMKEVSVNVHTLYITTNTRAHTHTPTHKHMHTHMQTHTHKHKH